jgi:hypothetical protein
MEITRPGFPDRTVRLNRINNPSVLSWFICSDGVSYGYSRYIIRDGSFGRYHPNNKTCAAYVDGHVDSRKVISGEGGDYSTDWEWFVVPPYSYHWWE